MMEIFIDVASGVLLALIVSGLIYAAYFLLYGGW